MSYVNVTIVNLPDKTLATTNCAFVKSTDWLAQVPHVEVGSCVFKVGTHEAMQPGTLALNSLQRKFTRTSVGDSVEAAAFQVPSENFNIVLLQGELDYVARRPNRPQLDIEAGDLTSHLLSRFLGQVLALGQEVAFEYQGVQFVLRVSNLMVLDRKHTQMGVPRGMLVRDTSFTYEAQNHTNIKVQGQKGVANAPALFKEKGLSFEKLGIGGLDSQFEQIFRRAFSSRAVSAATIERMGIRHVKGVLLYGPPGTGKTLIARQLGKMLNGREPKVVNGPEVLNKFVGESEANVRKLFEDAEADQKANGAASELHVIIFDEIDAICKQRGSVQSGSGVHDTLVNQLLTKIDGVDSLDNILLIGMTNRKDMLDEALLRPGRLEVQIEIGLPDEAGRLQILKIHTSRLQTNTFMNRDVNLQELAALTKNFSGAELEGLVKAASSYALNRQIDVSDLSKPIEEDNIRVAMEDFQRAMGEVHPAFGAVVDTLELYRLNGILDYGDRFRHLASTCQSLVEQVRNSAKTPLLTALLEGPAGTGKTALAASMGIDSDFPFVKIVSAENLVGYSEAAKCQAIAKVFDDAYKSPQSIIVLDDIERLVEYVAIGPRFSNTILQTLLVLLKKKPPEGRKLLVVGTTSEGAVMDEMGVSQAFNVALHVPVLREPEIHTVLATLRAFAPEELELATAVIMSAAKGGTFAAEMPIKRLLMLLELARQGGAGQQADVIDLERWRQVIQDLAS